MSGGIFISYRREDTQHAAARLNDRLEHEFSREQVFFDVETLPPGVDFVEEVEKKIDACDAFLVMIGEDWLDIKDAEGGRRLENPDDHVRVEIVRALTARKRIFPVRVDGASMPARKTLPDELKPLTHRNAVKLAHETFKADCDRLVELLKAALADAERDRQLAARAAEEAQAAKRAEEERRRQELEAERRREDERRRAEVEAGRLAARRAASEPVTPPQRARVAPRPAQRARRPETERPESYRPDPYAGPASVAGPARDAADPLAELAALVSGPYDSGPFDRDPDLDLPPPGARRPARYREVKHRRPTRRLLLGGGATVAVAAAAALSSGYWLPFIAPARKIESSAVLAGHKGRILGADIDATGTFAATAGEDGSARIWSLPAGTQQTMLAGHTGPVNHAFWSPGDGRGKLLTASDDRTARIWSGSGFQDVKVLEGHDAPVKGAAWLPDASRAVTGAGKEARIWAGDSGDLLAVATGPAQPILFVGCSPGSHYFVTTGEDGEVRVWLAESGKATSTLADNGKSVRMAAFSPDGTNLVTASWDGAARQYRPWWKPAAQQMRHDGWVVSARYSPDGARIVTASADDTAAIWDAANGARIATLGGHGGALTSAVFSPDGALVVTASSDRTARLWNGRTGEEIAVLSGHTGALYGARFTPDRSSVLTWSDDATARIWPVPDDLVA